MELIYIPVDLVSKVWPLIEDFVEEGVSKNDRYSVPSIKLIVQNGGWHMWVVWMTREKKPTAVLFTEIYDELSGIKVGSIRFLSGINRKKWLHLLSDLEDQMAKVGVQKLEVWARRGWRKEMTEYRMTHVLLEKDLENGQVEADDSAARGSTEVTVRSGGAGSHIGNSAG